MLVTGIHRAARFGDRGWLDTGDKPRYDKRVLLRALGTQLWGSYMAGNLGFDELKAAVKAGSIDTVLVAMVDMQGRLIGKRFQGEYFVDGAHKETHACDYLLANDIDMEPVPGYAAANWEKGYGDFIMKPDLGTLRRTPWLPGTALVLCDILDHHHHEPLPHSPRAILRRHRKRVAALHRGEDAASLRFESRV